PGAPSKRGPAPTASWPRSAQAPASRKRSATTSSAPRSTAATTAAARWACCSRRSCWRRSNGACRAGRLRDGGDAIVPRFLTIAAAQSGPISRQTTRGEVVGRLLEQMREARARGCDLVVFTECALTAFFPHWWIEDEAELDAWFEREMPGPVTQALFDEARRLRIGFYLGYAELAAEGGVKRRFNTSVLVGSDGGVIGKYRKIHLPGHADHRPHHPF